MAQKKRHGPAPVPPGNQPQRGPAPAETDAEQRPEDEGMPGQEQDPKRRLGNYGGTGEHPYQQPGGLNDANH
jgi:hypothetical protein